jgi:hypothetical protein
MVGRAQKSGLATFCHWQSAARISLRGEPLGKPGPLSAHLARSGPRLRKIERRTDTTLTPLTRLFTTRPDKINRPANNRNPCLEMRLRSERRRRRQKGVGGAGVAMSGHHSGCREFIHKNRLIAATFVCCIKCSNVSIRFYKIEKNRLPFAAETVATRRRLATRPRALRRTLRALQTLKMHKKKPCKLGGAIPAGGVKIP